MVNKMQQAYTKIQIVSVFIVLTLIGCASHDTTSVDVYNQFAIKAAQADLWNEAIFRWKQALSIDPDNAAAHNNLGVGYEALGKITEAVSAYQLLSWICSQIVRLVQETQFSWP